MLVWYLISIAYFIESFLTWFFNVYFVTDERIIDVDFYNLIYKKPKRYAVLNTIFNKLYMVVILDIKNNENKKG